MANSQKKTIDYISAWAKRRGFIFQSSEIYGGFAAVYDYGPYGVLLKNNIQDLWWKEMVFKRQDVVGLDSGIFMHPKTWEASGHVASFADVLVEDKKTHKRYRADQLIEEYFRKKGETVDMDKKTTQELQDVIKKEKIKSPDGNELTEPRNFNLLVKSNLGKTDSTFSDKDAVYLRGETCQGIYLNFKNVVDSMRVKLPFGIAQVGKAFRNEIIARQYIFRTREFEQLEMQYFLHPDDMKKKYEYWKQERWKWYIDQLGLEEGRLSWYKHEKLAHYASEAYDIKFDFESLGGPQEIEGIHARGDWDLSRHQEFSGTNQEYVDTIRGNKYIPHIMETSGGLTRMMYAVIDQGLVEEKLENGKTRVVFKIKPSLAPIKVAVFPLQKDEKLKKVAQNIYKDFVNSRIIAEFDDAGNIGKMYRRQDEIGTPYCVTIDFETLETETVTIRNRDTMKQERAKINDLKEIFEKKQREGSI